MSFNVNKVCLLGNVGREPEARDFDNGGRLVKFSLATTEGYKNKAGDWENKTTWHNIVIFNKVLGDRAMEKLGKGCRVYLEGQIDIRKYEKNGETKTVCEIVIPSYRGELIPLGHPSESRASAPAAKSEPAPAAAGDDFDDDIPF